MKAKIQFWQVESNSDMYCTTPNIEDCKTLIEEDFGSLDLEDQKEAQYTITPVWMTQKEYLSLPESDF